MTVVELSRTFASTDVDGALMSWWDSDAECTVAIARPSDNDALWQEYLDGAERSYRSHGISAAIDVDGFAGPATRRSSGPCWTRPARWSAVSVPSAR